MVWDLRTFEVLKKLTGHMNHVNSISLSPTKLLLASGSEDMIMKIWDLEKFECYKSFGDSTYPIASVKFSPDGLRIATGDSSGNIIIRDTSKFKTLLTLKPESTNTRAFSFLR